MSLQPLILTFVLLAFWTGLGWSLIAIVESGMPPLRGLFLAPVTGVAITILTIFWLSIVGLPVASFARPLLVFFCCVIVLAWIWRRPPWSRRDLIFAVPVAAAIILIGFPSLRFGLDWIANANDDWANYNLSAIRFMHDGFYQKPSLDAMLAGRDYPGFLWFLVVATDGRPGADLMLAFISAVTGKNPFFVFMPLILAFHGVFCFAAAGLAMSSISNRSALFAALVLTAIAPLSLYAVHQQLIAQVIGLAFMCAMACLTYVPFFELRSRGRIALASIIAAAYWIMYPETVPFFVLAFLVFHVSHIRDGDWGWTSWWTVVVISVTACVLAGPYSVSFFFYLMSQLQSSATLGVYDGVSIFPYFLVPSGLTTLFGFSMLGEFAREPFLSLSIAASVLILFAVVYGTVLGLARKSTISAFLVVVFVVTVLLLRQRNDFGIFKLAMFSQAFIWFIAVMVLARFRLIPSAVIYLFLLSTLVFTDVRYTVTSLREELGGDNSIPGASRDRLLTRLLSHPSDETCGVNFDTPDPPLIKILAATTGCARSFIARPHLFDQFRSLSLRNVGANPLHKPMGISQFAERDTSLLEPISLRLRFNYRLRDDAPIEIMLPQAVYYKTVTDRADDSIWIDDLAINSGTNRLTFLASSLGNHYYLPDFVAPTTVYATEKDNFFAGGKFAGVGRYLVFKVNSPTKSVRLVLDLTTSILGDGSASLPPANIVGESAVSVGFLGHGAARVVSPPFSPLIVDGAAYLLLDLGSDAKLLKVPRQGLMKLYGENVSLDYRRIVGFARQIRLVDASVELPKPPTRLNKFPLDLANRDLEFSGIYEDGWLGDQGFFVLSSDKPGKVFFRGLFPQGLGFEDVDLTLAVEDGQSVVRRLTPGPFEVELPVGAGSSRISFQFSAIGRLPAGDGRPAVALLSSVSIEPGDTRPPDLRTPLSVPKVIEGVGVDSGGIFSDGWLAKDAFVVIKSPKAGQVVMRGLIPGGVDLEGQEIEVISDAGSIIRKKLETGPFEIETPVKAGSSRLSIAFSRTTNLPKGDGRNVGALLKSIAVAPLRE
jgi:hypothetical protein